jgi:hypothetical protein
MSRLRIPLAHALLTVGLLLTIFGGLFAVSQVSSGGRSCGRAFPVGIGSASASASSSDAPKAADRPGTFLVSADVCDLALSDQRARSLGTLLPGITLVAVGIWPTLRMRWRESRSS